MLKELEKHGKHAADDEEATDPWYMYQVENMHRIVGTVLAILEAAPDDVFPTPEEGLALGECCEDLLLVVRHDRLELRHARRAEIQAARLPLGQRIAGASFQRLAGLDGVVAHGADSVVAWNPQLTTASAEFRVHGAYGIESADHREMDGRLVSLVATIDGQIYRLEDLQPAGSWRCPDDIPSAITLLADGRVFFLRGQFPIVELVNGRFVERLTYEQLLAKILSDPVLSRHWKERIAEETAYFGKPWPSALDQRFQHVHLERADPGDGEMLSLRLTLSFHRSDDLVVLLDPKRETLALAGHFLIRGRKLADYRIRPGGSSTVPRLAGVLLSEGEPEQDLAIWATAARTACGLMFARTGSTLRTDDDLIKMTFGSGDLCYAADDSGGLFQFSMADGQWREIDRDGGSPIAGLEYKAASALSAALQ